MCPVAADMDETDGKLKRSQRFSDLKNRFQRLSSTSSPSSNQVGGISPIFSPDNNNPKTDDVDQSKEVENDHYLKNLINSSWGKKSASFFTRFEPNLNPFPAEELPPMQVSEVSNGETSHNTESKSPKDLQFNKRMSLPTDASSPFCDTPKVDDLDTFYEGDRTSLDMSLPSLKVERLSEEPKEAANPASEESPTLRRNEESVEDEIAFEEPYPWEHPTDNSPPSIARRSSVFLRSASKKSPKALLRANAEVFYSKLKSCLADKKLLLEKLYRLKTQHENEIILKDAHITSLMSYNETLKQEFTDHSLLLAEYDIDSLSKLKDIQGQLDTVIHERNTLLQDLCKVLKELYSAYEREKIWVSAVANKDSQMENYRSEISALEQENDHILNQFLAQNRLVAPVDTGPLCLEELSSDTACVDSSISQAFSTGIQQRHSLLNELNDIRRDDKDSPSFPSSAMQQQALEKTDAIPPNGIKLISEIFDLKETRTRLLENKVKLLQEQISQIIKGEQRYEAISSTIKWKKVLSVWGLSLFFAWVFCEYYLFVLYSPEVIPM